MERLAFFYVQLNVLGRVCLECRGMVTNISTPTLLRYHFICYLSDGNSTDPHNEELLCRGQPVERRVASHCLFSHVCIWLYYSGKPVTLRRADLVAWDFPSQMCRWMCRLTTGKHIWKAFKPIWTCVGFTYTLWAQSLWKGVFLDRGAWRPAPRQVFPHQDTETTVALENEHSRLSLLFPHFWAENWPQESIVWAGNSRKR